MTNDLYENIEFKFENKICYNFIDISTYIFKFKVNINVHSIKLMTENIY